MFYNKKNPAFMRILAFRKCLLEKDAERRGELLFELQAEMEEHILPQRKLPGKERKKNISNKYKNNQKSSF